MEQDQERRHEIFIFWGMRFKFQDSIDSGLSLYLPSLLLATNESNMNPIDRVGDRNAGRNTVCLYILSFKFLSLGKQRKEQKHK